MELKPGARIHFLGICGTAMASLAGMLQSLGYKITGSDENVYPPMSTMLEKLGIPILPGYKKENLNPEPDLAIVGNIMSPNAEESIALMKSDIPRMSMPEAIGEFLIDKRMSLVAAGTHGKTTTTALLAYTAEVCDKMPGYLIGGIPKNFDTSFKAPQENLFIIEGDEYETCFLDKGSKFMHYRPFGTILHAIELDHIEYFKNFENLKNAFKKYIALIPEDGFIVSALTDVNTEILTSAKCKNILTFDWDQGDYQIKNFVTKGAEMKFDIYYKENKDASITLNQFGDYNALNALSVYILTTNLGWEKDKIVKAIGAFQGVKRRQEVIGSPNDIIVIEDFAHHPTAVKSTIESLNHRFDPNRLFSIFEPRSATSCRKIFQEKYLEALMPAQNIIIAPPNSFRKLDDSERLDVDLLVDQLKTNGSNALCISDTEEIIEYLAKTCTPGDVILIMSNGSFGGIYQKLLNRLAKPQ